MPEQTDETSMSLIGAISELKKGKIKIPDFQRDYLWKPDQVIELLDSIWNGYPIGTVLLWKTSSVLEERDPLNLKFPRLQEGVDKIYLLDGQQRLVTLYEVLHGILALGKSDNKKKYAVYFDLKKKSFYFYKRKDIEEKKQIEPKIEDWFLPLEDLMEIDYNTRTPIQNRSLTLKLSTNPDLLDAYLDLFLKFSSLKFPAITNGQELSVATKIFERLNNTGSPLNIVDLMVASSYNLNFNLRDKLKEIREEWELKNFDVPEKVILQCAAVPLTKKITKESIINSSKGIEKIWDKNTNSLALAINFLKKHCFVPNSQFIPNDILLIPLAYFFSKKPTLQLSNDLIKRLKRFFWLGVLSDRYDQSQDTKIEKDIEEMDNLLLNNQKDVFNHFVEITADDIKNTELSFASATSNALLCLLASRTPLEFVNNEKVDLELTFGVENQKELHHIFPRNFLKKQVLENKLSEKTRKKFENSLANVSLISRATNRAIWDKQPSVYFKEFEDKNKKGIQNALNSHLISNLEKFGIREDNFEKFIDERAKLMAEEIKSFVVELQKN